MYICLCLCVFDIADLLIKIYLKYIHIVVKYSSRYDQLQLSQLLLLYILKSKNKNLGENARLFPTILSNIVQNGPKTPKNVKR